MTNILLIFTPAVLLFVNIVCEASATNMESGNMWVDEKLSKINKRLLNVTPTVETIFTPKTYSERFEKFNNIRDNYVQEVKNAKNISNIIKNKEFVVRKQIDFNRLDDTKSHEKIVSGNATVKVKNEITTRDKFQSVVESNTADSLWDLIYSFLKCFKEDSTILECLRERTSSLLQDISSSFYKLRDYAHEEVTPRQNEFAITANSKEAFTPRASFKKELKDMMKALKYVSKAVLMVTPFLFFMKLKTMVLVSFSVSLLVLLAGKALLMGLVSFVLSVLAFLRSVDYGHHRVEEVSLYPFKNQRRDAVPEYLQGGRTGNEQLFM